MVVSTLTIVHECIMIRVYKTNIYNFIKTYSLVFKRRGYKWPNFVNLQVSHELYKDNDFTMLNKNEKNNRTHSPWSHNFTRYNTISTLLSLLSGFSCTFCYSDSTEQFVNMCIKMILHNKKELSLLTKTYTCKCCLH